MAALFLDANVERGRLYLKDQAQGTITNALYAPSMLCDAPGTSPAHEIDLITSASHTVCARTLLQVALQARGCAWSVAPLRAAAPSVSVQAVNTRRSRASYSDLARVLSA